MSATHITITKTRPKKIKWYVEVDHGGGNIDVVPATSATHAAQIMTEHGEPTTASRVYNLMTPPKEERKKRYARPLPQHMKLTRVTD